MSARRLHVLGILKAKRAPRVSEWLERNITIPKEWGSPGPVRFAGREYQRAILDLHHPEAGVTDVTVSAGTQIMKTFGMLMGRAFRMVHCPQPCLIVMPSMDFAKTYLAEQRLIPLIEENAVLRNLKPAAADDFKLLHMAMQGGWIDIVGSNSPTNLSGRTVGDVLQDEVCKFESRENKEAPESHPMLLADHRAKLFGSRAFRYKSSSPNIPSHPFWRSVEAGTQTVFAVPCPHCGEYFHFTWTYEESGYRSLVWDQLARRKDGSWDLDRVRQTARYICPHNGCEIRDSHKPDMIRAYEELDLNPGASRRKRSFIVPSFYSPTITFGDYAEKWLSRERDLFKSGTRDFINGWDARPYTEIEVKVGESDIRALICPEYARGQIPFVPQSLIVTADPGDASGVHWMVMAGAENGDLAVIDWGVALDLRALEEMRMVGTRWRYQIGNSRRVIAPAYGLCDAGYLPQQVWDLCVISGFWVPTRGTAHRYGAWTRAQVRSHPTLTQYVFVDSTLKTEVYDRRMKQGKGGRILLPADADEPLIAGLSGQEREAKTGKWKELPGDHYGDCLKQGVLDQWVRSAVEATMGSLAVDEREAA